MDKNNKEFESKGLSRRDFMAGMGAVAGATAVSQLLITPGTAQAANWPARPITAVVQYGAGGGTDVVLRAITTEMAKTTGWNINVINKPGAVGGVATNFMVKKPADGYWWLGAANYNKFVRVMGHSESVAWEEWQFFQAANSLASWSVKPDSKYKTLQDVIDDAKKRPGEVSISTSGTGGLWHELAAIVSQAAGINLKFVPYKGGKAATLAGLQGEVDIAGGGVHEHIDFIRAGKLRNLQQTSAKDIDVPGYGKMISVGNLIPSLKPMLPVGGVYNIALLRKTPVEILKRIEQAFVKAVNSDAFAAIAKKKYFEIDIRTGKDADRRAAQMESLTAATFLKLQEHIGKKVNGPKDLGLPEPKDFDAWWPPKGYKPRM